MLDPRRNGHARVQVHVSTVGDTLRALLEKSEVLDDPEAMKPYSADRAPSVPAGVPAAVVIARDVEDVARTVSFAANRGIPVVPRGAGTGEAGGATAINGCIVVALHELRRIVALSPQDRVAVIEPGVSAAELDAAAAEYGLRYAPDPGSRAISTIGGNIATNAGGFRGAKYGSTAEAVLGITAVLGDGSVVRLGHATLKGVAGLSLASLLVGSEGTLGIIVEATVRLIPMPVEPPVTALAFFHDFQSAVTVGIDVSNAGFSPAFVEAMDSATLTSIDTLTGSTLAAAGGAALLIQLDVGAVEHARDLERTLRDGGAADVELRIGVEASEELLAVRRSALPAAEALGKVLVEDVVVPRTQLAKLVAIIEDISAQHGVPILTVAHAADGNLHPTLVYSGDTPDARVLAAADAITAAALRLGGTITGEHGVGVVKRAALGAELDGRVLELHRRVKAAFDPSGILNPGKGY